MVARLLGDRVGVEHRDVGAGSLTQDAAAGPAKSGGRGAGHFVDGGFDRQQSQFAHVVAEDSSKCAIKARMRLALPGRPIRRDRVAIRSNHDFGRGDQIADIVLVTLIAVVLVRRFRDVGAGPAGDAERIPGLDVAAAMPQLNPRQRAVLVHALGRVAKIDHVALVPNPGADMG